MAAFPELQMTVHGLPASPDAERAILGHPARSCEHCGEAYKPRHTRQRFCSKRCLHAVCFKRDSLHRQWGTSSGDTGAITELMVCVDLMRQKIPVFRAQSPSAPFDLAALIGGNLVSIEVKTGQLDGNGERIKYPQGCVAQIMAVVYPDGIVYQPSLEVV